MPSKKTLVAILLPLFLFILVIHIRLIPYTDDDAYIHFRIAHNLAQFGKPYFNIDDPVMGSSSSVWTILLAGLNFLVSDLPLATAVINSLFILLGASIFAFLAWNITKNSVSMPVIFVVYLSFVIKSSTALMETPLALLSAGLGILLYHKNNNWAFFFLSVSIFVRLELFVLFVLLIGHAVIRRKQLFVSIMAFTFIGMAPFLIYDFFYFKSILPNTIQAKSLVYQLSFVDALKDLILSFVPSLPFRNFVISFLYQLVYLIFLIVVSFRTVKFFLRNKQLSQSSLEISILVFCAGFFVAIAYLSKKTLLFAWYLPLFTFPILFACAISYLSTNKTRLAEIAFGVLAIPMLVYFSSFPYSAFVDPSYLPGFEAGARVRKYIETGQRLYQSYPSAILMSSEIGGLGYGFPGKVIDAVGLTFPEALNYHPLKIPEERSSGYYGAIPVGLIKEIKPDIIVSYDVFIEGFVSSPECTNYEVTYEPVFLLEDLNISGTTELWNSKHLNIFFRKEFLTEINRTE